jgi:hypothetical protein
MINKGMVKYEMDSCRSEKKPVGGSCERVNEPLGVKKWEHFLKFTVWGTANFSRTTYLIAWYNEEKTFLDELD